MAQNILILTNSIFGLHSFRKEVVKAICDAGYKVHISVPEDHAKADYFRGIGCEIILNRFNSRGMNPLADLKLMLAYRKLMKKLKPKAVLTYTIKPNIYGGLAARVCRVPQLANVTGLGDAMENGGWLQILTKGLYKLGIGKAYKVFIQNETNRRFCINSGIADSSSVLLPGSGVNLQHHVYQDYPKEESIIHFLFIGRLIKDKGASELFETIRCIKNKYPHIEFQIIGTVENDYKKELEALVAAGSVVFYGEQLDIRPYIGAVECTIMPSYHEGMSNVNLESAANGRPVITTNVPGCRETVDDGVSGFLVKAKDSQSLIEGVERFLNLTYEQKKQMGVEGRKKVEKEFDRKIVVKEYLNAIENISNV